MHFCCILDDGVKYDEKSSKPTQISSIWFFSNAFCFEQLFYQQIKSREAEGPASAG